MTAEKQDTEFCHPETVAFFANFDGQRGGFAASFDFQA